jgi:DNA-directed RNA polymerase I, II, and III subunit RPABC2
MSVNKKSLKSILKNPINTVKNTTTNLQKILVGSGDTDAIKKKDLSDEESNNDSDEDSNNDSDEETESEEDDTNAKIDSDYDSDNANDSDDMAETKTKKNNDDEGENNDNDEDENNDNDEDDDNDEDKTATNNIEGDGLDLTECLLEDEDISNEIEEETKVPDDKRVSFPKLTKYERVRILATRTKQLALGAPPLVKNIAGKSPHEIAVIELNHNMIPFLIKRSMPNNTYEIWRLSELDK